MHGEPEMKTTEGSVTEPLHAATCSTARAMAVELAKQIEQQDNECEYPHVPTDRLEKLLEKFFKDRGLARYNDRGEPQRGPDGSPAKGN